MAWSGHGEGRSCPYPTAALHKDYWARRGPPRSRGDGRVLNSTSRLEAVMMGVYYMMGVHDGRMLTGLQTDGRMLIGYMMGACLQTPAWNPFFQHRGPGWLPGPWPLAVR